MYNKWQIKKGVGELIISRYVIIYSLINEWLYLGIKMPKFVNYNGLYADACEQVYSTNVNLLFLTKLNRVLKMWYKFRTGNYFKVDK